jgi:hypothetical protein
MKKVSKAERILDRVANRKLISSEGRDWLTLSLDPFHDLDHQVAGYPDADTSKTIVSCYQYALDIAKPANITTATWDAHVFTLPFTGANGYHDGASFLTNADGTYMVIGAAGHSSQRGILNVEINDAGVNLFPTSDAEANAATRTALRIPVSSSIFDGSMTRVISCGFEVIDTTADVYKQGALTAYRMPQMQAEGSYVLSNAAFVGKVAPSVAHTPPATVAQALSLCGTRQWQASQGAYVVCTQSSTQNPMRIATAKSRAIVNGSGKTAYGELTNCGSSNNVPPAVSVIEEKRTMSFPFNTSGVFMTGLNALSTFRIKFKIYVETAPLPWQNDLVVLATPSAPFDPKTLELYSKALTHVPVAVIANDNDFGDWFAGIADIVGDLAGPVSAAMAPWTGGLTVPIGMATGAIAKASSNVVRGQKNDDRLYSGSQASGRIADDLSRRMNPVKQTRIERQLSHLGKVQQGKVSQKNKTKTKKGVASGGGPRGH